MTRQTARPRSRETPSYKSCRSPATVPAVSRVIVDDTRGFPMRTAPWDRMFIRHIMHGVPGFPGMSGTLSLINE